MNGINFDQLEGIFWLFENIKNDMIKKTILAPSVLYDKHILSKAYVDLEMGHEDGGVLYVWWEPWRSDYPKHAVQIIN